MTNKDKSYYTKRAKEIINKIKYLTLATVSEDGTPWNSPVSYSVDENFNFYFWFTQRHSTLAKYKK